MSDYLIETQDFRVRTRWWRRTPPLSLALVGGEATAICGADERLLERLGRGLAGLGPYAGSLILQGKPKISADKAWRRSVAYLGPHELQWRGRIGNLIDLLNSQHARLRRDTANASLRNVGLGRGLWWPRLTPGDKAAAEFLLVAARSPDFLLLDRFLPRLALHPYAGLILEGLLDHFRRFEKAMLIVGRPARELALVPDLARVVVLGASGDIVEDGAPTAICRRYVRLEAKLAPGKSFVPHLPSVLETAAYGRCVSILAARREEPRWRGALAEAGILVERESTPGLAEVAAALTPAMPKEKKRGGGKSA